MGGAREGANLWNCLTTKRGLSRLWGRRSIWTNEYLLHDSFGVYFNRYIKCKLFNHKNIKDISDHRDYVELHCFDCENKFEFPNLFFGTEPPPPTPAQEHPQFSGSGALNPVSDLDNNIGSLNSEGIRFEGKLDKMVFTDGDKAITAKEIYDIKNNIWTALALFGAMFLLGVAVMIFWK
jgi:hypothetical protein